MTAKRTQDSSKSSPRPRSNRASENLGPKKVDSPQGEIYRQLEELDLSVQVLETDLRDLNDLVSPVSDYNYNDTIEEDSEDKENVLLQTTVGRSLQALNSRLNKICSNIRFLNNQINI